LEIKIYSKKILGFKVGFKQKEKGIMIGQYIVALGEFVYSKASGVLRMEKPLYMLKDKAQLVKRFQDKKLGIQRNLIIWSGAIAIFGYLFVRRLVKFYYKAKVILEEISEREKNEKLGKISEIMTDDFRCVTCWDKPKNIILKPCMHMALCGGCLRKLPTNKCPICKETIQDVVKIYIA
jgi:hypothetical protein